MTIITAAEIQKGDLIRVTRDDTTMDRKGSIVHEGVAGEFTFDKWRTPNGWQLYTERNNAVIELLDRPEPELVIPTLPGAVVQYKFLGSSPRTAIRDADGSWKCYDDDGYERDSAANDDWFRGTLREHGDYDIVFAGVVK